MEKKVRCVGRKKEREKTPGGKEIFFEKKGVTTELKYHPEKKKGSC